MAISSPTAIPSQQERSGHHSEALYRASLFSCAAWLARCLPLGMIRFLAAFSGKIYALTHQVRVDVVLKNLRLLDAAIDRKIARRVYSEFAQTLADYFYIGTRPQAEVVKIIAKKSGYENLEVLHRKGMGAVIVTAHLGLFELGGLLMAHHGFPSAVLTLPEPSGSLTAWRAQFRQGWGVDTIEVGADSFVFIKIAQRLREGGFVAALIDRPTSHEPSPVTFPNGTARFSAGILLVAQQAGVPVVPATMVRQPDGFYKAEVFSPIFIEPHGSRAETLRFYSQQIADTLIPTLCAHPEQWYQFAPLT